MNIHKVHVHFVKFAENSSKMLVTTADGKMVLYDTASFNEMMTVEDLGSALKCAPVDGGKYIAVLTSDTRVCIVNLLDTTERHFFETGKGAKDIRIAFDVNKNTWMINNTENSLIYRSIEGLTPYFNQMLTNELNDRLNQWMKQLPGETMEEYQLRVTEETRMAKAKELEQEIATRMATGLLEASEITLGDYNTSNNKLALKIDEMSTIYIEVPLEEIAGFASNGNLEFKNVKYGLNPDDKFEVIYADVYDPTTGKTYTFDNTERQSLAAMAAGNNLVSLDIIKQTNMEEIALMNIKEDIMNLAKEEQTISDKTHISVNTNAEPDVDADGNRIVNYNVRFTYEVEEEFSARDDFKPGHYHTEESGAAMSMLKIMKKAFETDFAQYITEGKKVKFAIKGTADASPINGSIAYDGRYGEYEGLPVYKDNELTNITLTKKGGITDNDQLAFTRALGVKHYMDEELAEFNKMQRDYDYHIEVSKEEGSKYRRISVQCTFIDAF